MKTEKNILDECLKMWDIGYSSMTGNKSENKKDGEVTLPSLGKKCNCKPNPLGELLLCDGSCEGNDRSRPAN